MNKFVLLTSQRSGSTFSRLLLNTHPQIHLYSELFHVRYRPLDGFKHFCESKLFGKSLYKLFNSQLIERRLFSPVANIRDQYTTAYLDKLTNDREFPLPWIDISDDSWLGEQPPRKVNSHDQAIGFQLMYQSLIRYPAINDWFDKQTKVIHLYRANSLKKQISIVNSKTAPMAAHFNTKDKKRTVWLDPETIMETLEKLSDKIDEHREKFKDNPYMEYSYEDFFSNREPIVKEALEFLEIEEIELSAPGYLKKLSSDNLADIIENFNEVKEVLAGSKFEWMLE